MEFDSLPRLPAGRRSAPRRLARDVAARSHRRAGSFSTSANHTVLIAVDASRLMAATSTAASKLDYAVDAGLALAYAALQAGDRVGLIAFDRDVRGFCAPRATGANSGY
jgi:uncharacterized protein (DUF58 family)